MHAQKLQRAVLLGWKQLLEEPNQGPSIHAQLQFIDMTACAAQAGDLTYFC
jgi:hypothetical protein